MIVSVFKILIFQDLNFKLLILHLNYFKYFCVLLSCLEVAVGSVTALYFKA